MSSPGLSVFRAASALPVPCSEKTTRSPAAMLVISAPSR